RTDRHGRVPEHPAPSLAAAAHHARHRDCTRGNRCYLVRRKRHREVAYSESGRAQPAALVRGLPTRAVYLGPRQDGRVHEFHVGEGARLRRRVHHRRPQRVAAGPDFWWLAALMYKRILVPVENTSYDEAILNHVRGLAKLCGASVVLIHVADGWAARNANQLDLRESEEMRKDREYLEHLSDDLERDGIDTDSILAGGEPSRETVGARGREGGDLMPMAAAGPPRRMRSRVLWRSRRRR